MKKYILPILIFVMFIPIIVNAETCDIDKITISSITLDKKSENVTEIEEATANGKNIILNLSMLEIGDNIKYKIVVKNDSNEDYQLDKNSININSDFIEYTLESDDNSNIVKAKSSKTVQLKVQYKNEVPENQFESGTFNYNKNLALNLSTHESSILKNPITGVHSYLFIFIIILLLSIFILTTKRKKKYAKFMILIIEIAIIIPISTYALCKSKIDIESKITINQRTFTGVIYRHNDNQVNVGDSIRPKEHWTIEDTENIIYTGLNFETKNECEIEKQNLITHETIPLESNLICKKYIKSAGDYTLSTSELNKNYYIRNEVENNIITKAQVCFITDKEVCLNDPGIDTPAYMRESNILMAEKEWFELNGGTCTYHSYDQTECRGAGFNKIYIGWMTGYAYVEGLDHIQCTSNSCSYNENH